MNLPVITINGERLSQGQIMTLQVALTTFAMDLKADGLGDDNHGRAMVAAYLNNIRDTQTLMDRPAGGDIGLDD